MIRHNTHKTICPVCESSNYSLFGHREEDIFECLDCKSLYFRRPIQTDDVYDDYYDYLKLFDRQRFEWELKIRKKKYEHQINEIISLHPNAKNLLDIGAGPGYFCHVASEKGLISVGVELNEDAKNAGKTQFGVSYEDFDKIPPDSYDIVTMHHVLEHIEWPADFLKSIHEKMRPDGLLVIHVPRKQSLSAFLRHKLHNLYGSNKAFCSLYYPEHITGFDISSLTLLASRAGFKKVKCFSRSMWSKYYDPFFLKLYYEQKNVILATSKVALHAMRCAVDVLGNPFGYGDWIIGYFRKK